MKVHWTNRAKARLKLIHQYVANDSSNAADKIIKRLVERTILLGKLPQSGHPVENPKYDGLRELFVRPYRIIYLINKQQIDIITMMHYRQLLPDDLTKK